MADDRSPPSGAPRPPLTPLAPPAPMKRRLPNGASADERRVAELLGQVGAARELSPQAQVRIRARLRALDERRGPQSWGLLAAVWGFAGVAAVAVGLVTLLPRPGTPARAGAALDGQSARATKDLGELHAAANRPPSEERAAPTPQSWAMNGAPAAPEVAAEPPSPPPDAPATLAPAALDRSGAVRRQGKGLSRRAGAAGSFDEDLDGPGLGGAGLGQAALAEGGRARGGASAQADKKAAANFASPPAGWAGRASGAASDQAVGQALAKAAADGPSAATDAERDDDLAQATGQKDRARTALGLLGKPESSPVREPLDSPAAPPSLAERAAQPQAALAAAAPAPTSATPGAAPGAPTNGLGSELKSSAHQAGAPKAKREFAGGRGQTTASLAPAEQLAAQGRCAEALPLFDQALADLRGTQAERSPAGERALFGRGQCRLTAGDVAGGRGDLAGYLATFPQGRFSAAARQLLVP